MWIGHTQTRQPWQLPVRRKESAFENFAHDAPKRTSTGCRLLGQQGFDLCPVHGDNQFNFRGIRRDWRIALSGVDPDEFLSGIGTGGELKTFPDGAGR